jgi:Domain of unknown function (DUF4383)
MTLLSHLPHPTHLVPRRPPGRAERAAATAPDVPGEQPLVDQRVYAVQRAGAVLVALVLAVFGLLGFTTGVPMLTTHGAQVLGLSSNGLLSVLSLVVAAVLVTAALRGPRVASTVMLVLGVLFLLSALGNMAVLRTGLNLLAFRMSNVLFSVVVGLLLLVLGAYGRISGNLPTDSPYAHPHEDGYEPPDGCTTPEEVAAEAAMRRAEIAVVEHHATEDQRRRVQAMAAVHTRPERRRVWLDFDRAASRDADLPG